MRTAIHLGFFALLLSASPLASSDESREIDRLLSLQEPPSGVVFEVVTADDDALENALPRIKKHALRLRQRFPELSIAVVTHGLEQFSLMSSEITEYPDLHALAKELTNTADIPVQVCGTHASWQGQTPEDFPDYIEVVAAAPAQINDYRQLGYIVIDVE
ncbi:MAG: hypothetical protein DRQ37_05955 [Gammaproteobacteria bacterium]|nr:MAG: hypothetical protein DRQ37_05955 [Gammaproteobacteria bacterium]